MRGAHSSSTWPAILGVAALLLAGPAAVWPQEGAPPTEDAVADFQAAGIKKFRKPQKRPIRLGTSGGNIEDFELDPPFITCTSGTLGALLAMDGAEGAERYLILSNNHVLAMTNQGRAGDPVVQPGLIDSDCEASEGDAVATLTGYKKIRVDKNKKNKVDLALAEALPGMVRTDGRILKLGIPGSTVVEPSIGQAVQKIGRTSGRTRGTVSTVNAVLNVDFSSGGAGSGGAATARFVKQIIVNGKNGPFVEGGDSGSAVYEDVKSCPRAVGLAFAGSGSLAAVNPMAQVLKAAKSVRPKGEKRLVGCIAEPEPAADFAAASRTAAIARRDDRLVRRAARIQERWSDDLMARPGMVAFGIGLEGDGDARRAVFRLLVERADREILDRLPSEIEGVPVRVTESGRFRAF